MSFWAEGREAAGWYFKGKVGNSQVDEKEQMCDKQILDWPPETTGHRVEPNRLGWVRPVCHTTHTC